MGFDQKNLALVLTDPICVRNRSSNDAIPYGMPGEKTASCFLRLRHLKRSQGQLKSRPEA